MGWGHQAHAAKPAGAPLPEDFGQVTIMTGQCLGGVQATAHRLDRFRWGVVLAAYLWVSRQS